MTIFKNLKRVTFIATLSGRKRNRCSCVGLVSVYIADVDGKNSLNR